MKVIAITNNKGGVGKTFLAVNLGWYLQRKGYRVLVIDMDEEQADATKWITGYKVKDPDFGKMYEGNDGLKVVWGQGKDVRIKEGIEEKFDFIVIDGRPSVSIGGTAIWRADLVIFPVDGRLSVENLGRLLPLIEEVKGVKQRVIIINRHKVRTGLGKIQFDLARAIGAELFPYAIGDTVRIGEAENQGVSIWDVKGSRTRDIVDAFYEDIWRRLNETK